MKKINFKYRILIGWIWRKSYLKLNKLFHFFEGKSALNAKNCLSLHGFSYMI